MLLCSGAPKPELLAELAANCGAECTSANPDFATWWFKWLRFPNDPRGTPIPADPECRTNRDGPRVEPEPPFPTMTVFTVPVGGTRGWTVTKLVAV